MLEVFRPVTGTEQSGAVDFCRCCGRPGHRPPLRRSARRARPGPGARARATGDAVDRAAHPAELDDGDVGQDADTNGAGNNARSPSTEAGTDDQEERDGGGGERGDGEGSGDRGRRGRVVTGEGGEAG
ncbi:hypothetical protein ACE1SV_63370 [Streptomyces sennicomposti]